MNDRPIDWTSVSSAHRSIGLLGYLSREDALAKVKADALKDIADAQGILAELDAGTVQVRWMNYPTIRRQEPE